MSAFRNMKVEKMEGRKKKFMRFQSDIGSPDIFLDPKAFLNTKHEPFKNESVRQLGKWSGFQGFGKPFSFGVSRVFSEDIRLPRLKFLTREVNSFKTGTSSLLYHVSLQYLSIPSSFICQSSRPKICVFFDNSMKISVTVLRTIADISYLFHMVLQFRTAFIAPSSRIFGRGELVVDPFQIARRYLRKDFWVDFAAVLPLPQFFVWVVLPAMKGTVADNTKNAFRLVVLIQYVPRFLRIFPLTSQMVKTTGVVTETAWGGAAYNLALYMLASHI